LKKLILKLFQSDMRSLILIVGSFLLSITSLSQDFSSLKNCKVLRSAEFSKESLWGHINGGADLYLEYGFNILHFTELRVDSFTIRVEDYEMSDSESAFGIYSISHFKCSPLSDIPVENCQSRYQLQLLSGNHYISIVNSSGTVHEQQIALSIAKLLLENIGVAHFTLPGLFNHNLFKDHLRNLKLYKGILALQNAATSLVDYFQNYQNYLVYSLSIPLSQSYLNISLVNFVNNPSPGDFPVAYGFDTSPDESFMQYRVKISPSVFVLVEYDEPATLEEESFIKNILVHLETLEIQ